MFVRILTPSERFETLVNVDHISKIEVSYGVRSEDGNIWTTSLRTGQENPDAVRVYRVYSGGEVYELRSNPDCPVMKVFEEIYKAAIKG